MDYSSEYGERLQLLNGLTDVALSHLELDERLSALVERAQEIIGASCSVILLEEGAVSDAPGLATSSAALMAASSRRNSVPMPGSRRTNGWRTRS